MDFKAISEFITTASPLVLFISVGVGVYCFKRLDTIGKLLWLYLAGSLIIDLLSRLLAEMKGNNLFLFFVLTFLELFVFLLLYYHLVKKKKIILVMAVFGIVYTVVETIYVNAADIKVFQPYSKALVPLLIVMMSLLFFFELIRDEENLYKNEGDYLVLNSMILCFFSLEFLIFLPMNFLVNNAIQLVGYVLISNVFFMILFYLYLTYFIWKRGKNLKP